jgi:predicted GIY-YIG superfamily endonuclease
MATRKYCRLYIAKCKALEKYYVGTTTRLPYERYDEHMSGKGSYWTTRHGFEGFLICEEIDPLHGNQLETDMTKYMMAVHGWSNVRGGAHTYATDDHEDWWMPPEFKNASATDILKLRSGTVSKFPSELRRLVDCYLAVGGLEHADHLDSKPFSELLLRNIS